MKLNLSIILSISGLVFAALQKRQDPPGCHADNCLRAIRATTQLPQASADCSSFLVETVTPPPAIVVITSTVIAVVTKRAAAYGPIIPTYASACIDIDAYSSACSCIGITATTTTLPPYIKTVTATVTATPPCTGEVCSTGFIPTCNAGNTNCFCFTNSKGNGFCGQNNACEGLTSCKTDTDCEVEFSSGDTCAVNTCCGVTGICLVGICENPSFKLRRMGKGAMSRLVGGTAAFKGN